MNAPLTSLFHILSQAPLWLLHLLGSALGWLAFLASPTYRRRLLANAAMAHCTRAQTLASIAQAGQLVAELPRIWLGRDVPVRWEGAELLDAALGDIANQGRKPVLLMTPHVGSFEAVARAYAMRFGTRSPMTVLYRPARQLWLRPLMADARNRPGLHAVATDLSGVKALIKTLRQGGCVGLLPDQVPPDGMGAWAPFFGENAYTMTLATRLIAQTSPTVLMLWAERLSWGQGFVVRCSPVGADFAGSAAENLTQLNQEVEQVVRRCPQQYLWGYARYKHPKAAP